MYFAAAPVWNDIASSQKLKTQWARDRFILDHEAIGEAWDMEADHLEKAGINATVVHAYLKVKPLLLENVAISNFIMDSGRDLLRMALPDICTVYEAVTIADMDMNGTMTELQQKQLADLLNASMPDSECNDFIAGLSREAFDSALQIFRNTHKRKKRPFTLKMVFSETCLLVEALHASVEIPLQSIIGTPQSMIIFPGQLVTGLYGTYLTSDTLYLSLMGGKFKIEKVSLPCHVINPEVVEL